MAEEATERKIIDVFQTRARQLMYEFEKVRGQRDMLQAQLEEKNKMIEDLRQQVEGLQNSYHNLKTAKMLEIHEGDVEKSKKKIDSLIRQVDRCIALLNI